MRIASTAQLLNIFMRTSTGFGSSRTPLLMSTKQHISSSTNAAYKQVLTDEINRKKLTLAGDQQALDRMMDDFYVPVYMYFKGLLDNLSVDGHPRPLFIGISAPQGVGKTTLTEFMRALFAAEGKRCLSVSIDDFYLTGNEQDSLAAAHPTNPLLKFRGNAGSHDIQLMEDTLRALGNINDRINDPLSGSARTTSTTSTASTSSAAAAEAATGAADAAGRVVRVPQYDKSLRGGRGDRAAVSEWLEVRAPLDVVLLEGWMLGFTPVGEDVVAGGANGGRGGVGGDGVFCENGLGGEGRGNSRAKGEEEGEGVGGSIWDRHPGMVEVNRQLRRYQHLHELFDAWLVLAVEDEVGTGQETGVGGAGVAVQTSGATSSPDDASKASASRASTAAGIGAVYAWRLQAETAMRAAGRPGLSDAQVADFVARFMPAYEAYLPMLYSKGPQRRERGQGREVPVLKVTVDINRYPVNSRLMGDGPDNVHPHSRL